MTAGARAALHIPDDGIIDSIRLTIGYAELAAATASTCAAPRRSSAFAAEGGRILGVRTPDGPDLGPLRGQRRRVGADDALGTGRRRDVRRPGRARASTGCSTASSGGRFSKVVGGVPTPLTRGIYAVPTTNRSLLLGPTAEDHEDRGRPRRRRRHARARVRAPPTRWCRQPAPRARDQDVRRQPAGLRSRLPGRAATDRRRTWSTRRGSARPASRRRRRWPSCVRDAGRRAGARGGRGPPGRRPRAGAAAAPALDRSAPEELVALDPRYGQVVCACEQVTAAEIAAAYGDRAAAALAGRAAQADAGDRRPLPGRGLPGRRLVHALAAPATRPRGSPSPSRGRPSVSETVAIVGAGITGLACAEALEATRWSSTGSR